ncbi:protein spire isoform X2 [Orussus abietinus]|uniref:protein spire isoform X2 n=1 Tax=Orussus abietinus TaxID=222816 RepID=UPI000C7161D8|nr:protein spire isoform X2 [Orussus abietinus]
MGSLSRVPQGRTACVEKAEKMNGESSDAEKRRRRSKRPRCKLDPSECLNLQDILLSFNGPISQEQTWALCYQAAKTLARTPRTEFQELTDLSQILLHKDGDVRVAFSDSTSQPVSESKMVFSLGMMLFKALDFGLDEQEERPLSPDLEDLISVMTHSSQKCEPDSEERLQETDDEGIERDSGDTDLEELLMQRTNDPYTGALLCSLENSVRLCTRHMQGTREQADAHYRAVIRALVTEALELSQFLDKVANEKQQSHARDFRGEITLDNAATHHLDALDFNDWARFWVQVIGELRRGVKLKKVEAGLGMRGPPRGRGAEFELTPYEILMDDIRERRYRLRKTPAPSPHLRKDARAVILEFIRSRPPLKKASERKLPPLKRQCTMRELLMESIKRPPRPLRSSRTINTSRQHSVLKETPNENKEGTQDATGIKESEIVTTPKTSRRGSADLNYSALRQPRKLIPVDFDLKLDADDEDDEDFEVARFDDEDVATNYWRSKEDYVFGNGGPSGKRICDPEDEDEVGSANPWRKTGSLRLTKNEYHRFCDTQLESYDLATQCPSRRASARKHAPVGNISLTACTGTTSLPHSRPHSRQHRHEGVSGTAGSSLSPGQSPSLSLTSSPSLSPRPRARPRPSASLDKHQDAQDRQASEQKPSLGDMFLDERLSLTLEEIVHIRSVLTKAELESLPVEGRVKEDVEKRRVCFLCLKTRFGILGPWGQRCRLCDRTVCVKCYSKMRIPTEHFAHVPVVLLSPGLLLSPSNSEPDSGNRSPWTRPVGAVGSAPASPANRRRESAALRSASPASTPSVTPGGTTSATPAPTPPLCRGRIDDDHDRRSCKSAGSPARLPSAGFGLNSEQRLAAERLRGVAMVVCHDCRIMVIQIIKSSRTTRATIRNNVISRLTLDLSPAYV